MRELSYRALWLTGGAALVVVVIVLSLVPSPESVLPPSLQDKTGHVIAYFTLMAWFAGIWLRPAHLALAASFVGLGLLLEWLQGFVPPRVTDPVDMLANLAGVVLGLVASRVGLDRWCTLIERSTRGGRAGDGA